MIKVWKENFNWSHLMVSLVIFWGLDIYGFMGHQNLTEFITDLISTFIAMLIFVPYVDYFFKKFFKS